MLPRKVRCRFFQERVFHFQFSVLPLQFPQPRPLRQFQRRLVTGMRLPIGPHPIPQGGFTHPQLARHLGDNSRPLNHHFRRLFTKLRRIRWVFPRHKFPSFPEWTLNGPQSGKREARLSVLLPYRLFMVWVYDRTQRVLMAMLSACCSWSVGLSSFLRRWQVYRTWSAALS